MPVLTDWKIEISVDDVIRKQNAKPEILKQRSPYLYTIAEKALADSYELFDPFIMYEVCEIEKIDGENLILDNGTHINGKVVQKHLQNAKYLLVCAGTISDKLEKKVSESFKSDASYALALDAAGIAAMGNLSSQAKKFFKENIIPKNCAVTMALNPGMTDWPISEGQPLLFSILSKISDRIKLTETCLMRPSKSVSFIFGIGEHVNPSGSHCDECERRFTCMNSDLLKIGSKP